MDFCLSHKLRIFVLRTQVNDCCAPVRRNWREGSRRGGGGGSSSRGGGGRPRRARWNTVHSPQSPQQSQQQPPPDAGIGTSYAQQPHSAGSLTCLYTLDAYLTQFVSFVPTIPFEKLTYLPQRGCDSGAFVRLAGLTYAAFGQLPWSGLVARTSRCANVPCHRLT